MTTLEDQRTGLDSRWLYIIVLLCTTIGPNIFVILPNKAVQAGAAGHIIAYTIAYIIFGIPLLYMEFIIAQFTGRDCIDVWKARSCLSHIGYIHIFSQIILIMHNHLITSFVFHYFLISFEEPIPYYICGSAARNDCNIIKLNYTVNRDCINVKKQASYCDNLYETFPEYQYWKMQILGLQNGGFYIAWRVCLASGLGCIFIYLNCFKRHLFLSWFLKIFTFYPMIGYLVLMMGSMLQKGFIVTFDTVLDSNFSLFSEYYRLGSLVQHVIIGLNIGTGISFNLASNASFRSPCFSNVVITVITCCAITVLVVFSVAIMACPHSYQYGVQPFRILKIRMSVLFETVPIFLRQYNNQTFWLILVFSCNTIVAVSTNVLLMWHLYDILAKRYTKINNSLGLVSSIMLIILFCITIPILGNIGINVLLEFKRFTNFISTFMAMIECVVFVLWYGIGKFSEDVHFMQGLPPNNYIKIIWLSSCCLLGYVFFTEVYYLKMSVIPTLGGILGWWTLVFVLVSNIILVFGKLVVSAFRKNLLTTIRLDPSWGPKKDILLRSRAMFTAQAMTKEYLYRQYHLQAGIIARQKASNIRQ